MEKIRLWQESIGMGNPGPSVRLRSSARTSTGQVRENNEDNIHLWARGPYVLAVVADGMGGAAAGEEASRLAVEAIGSGLVGDVPRQETLEVLGDDQLAYHLRQAIQEANDRIVEKAQSAPEFRGMGTTVTLAFVRGTSAAFAHVGDSRAYLVDGDDGRITQITSDHSFVEALLTAGHITREQAEEHPMRNVLYRALGQAEDVDIDLYYKHLHVGDRLVLCSDGLTRHVKPDEIARIALEQQNPDAASQRLIDLANERGGEDNVSVIVIAVEASAPPNPPKNAMAIEDEEETLILKNRVEVRKRRQETTSETKLTPGTPPSDTPPDERKMSAERLSDDEDPDDPNTLPVLDRAWQSRSDQTLYEHRAPPPDRRQGKQGEGRDNLMPEQ
ncbi:MAG: Stp1/IreP family PP2C-type Ser/Thr phosphatase [Chloroflexi bacterium]|nr:Stp1/IreP family PP2C-type Ser/Thr phosphatase [Chloroflexota bacterium]